MTNNFSSTHKLDFLAAPHRVGMAFKVGTCHGLFSAEWDSYIIIAIYNDEAGNGHLDDVFEWFENSCQRDKKNLIVAAIMNEKFFTHLITKRNFKKMDSKGENVIKAFQ
jgi:hypothetical protein